MDLLSPCFQEGHGNVNQVLLLRRRHTGVWHGHFLLPHLKQDGSCGNKFISRNYSFETILILIYLPYFRFTISRTYFRFSFKRVPRSSFTGAWIPSLGSTVKMKIKNYRGNLYPKQCNCIYKPLALFTKVKNFATTFSFLQYFSAVFDACISTPFPTAATNI